MLLLLTEQLQVLALHDSVFCKTSLEAATACGISNFTRSRDSCLLLKSKCNFFSKQEVVKTLSKTQVFRWHSVICQLLNWFIEIVTTNLEHDNSIPCLLPLTVFSWRITFSTENWFPFSLTVHSTEHLPQVDFLNIQPTDSSKDVHLRESGGSWVRLLLFTAVPYWKISVQTSLPNCNHTTWGKLNFESSMVLTGHCIPAAQD